MDLTKCQAQAHCALKANLGGISVEGLRADLKRWLRDKNILESARSLLRGDETLNDTRISNWLRSDREWPKALSAGAALGLAASVNPQTPSTTAKIVADEFWQLFTIEAPNKETSKCNGVAYRYWTGVRSITDVEETLYFSHQSYYSAKLKSDKVAYDLFSKKYVEKQWVEEAKEDSGEAAGRVTVSWEVAPSHPTSLGYSVPATNVISADDSNEQQFDYVGGMSSIPVRRAITIVKLPAAIFAQSKPARLHTLQFLNGTASFNMIELHLSEKLHKRYLGPWFNWLRETKPIPKTEINLPEPLKEHLESSEEGYLYFQFEIAKPEPYLTYLAAFELRKSAMKE
jgi:hypothetical protein